MQGKLDINSTKDNYQWDTKRDDSIQRLEPVGNGVLGVRPLRAWFLNKRVTGYTCTYTLGLQVNPRTRDASTQVTAYVYIHILLIIALTSMATRS